MTTEITSPDNIKREINDARDRIKSRMAKSVQDIIDIGFDLIDVKEKLGHGEFQHWVKSELGISPRTAQNFMNAANHLGSKSELISHLPPTVVYALAAPSMPGDVRATLMEVAEKGDLVTETMVKKFREQAAVKKQSSVSEKDMAEPNSVTVLTPETEKTDGADPPTPRDKFRDACKAVLAEEGERGVLEIIRELIPGPVTSLVEAEVDDLLAELEARGATKAALGVHQLARKWADTVNTGGITEPESGPAGGPANAPGSDNDMPDIPPSLDRRQEVVRDDHV
jgi:hypothetical protein